MNQQPDSAKIDELRAAVKAVDELYKTKHPPVEWWKIIQSGERILNDYGEKFQKYNRDNWNINTITEACVVLNAIGHTRLKGESEIYLWIKILEAFLKNKWRSDTKPEDLDNDLLSEKGSKKFANKYGITKLDEWDEFKKQRKNNPNVQIPNIQKTFVSKFFHFFIDDSAFPIDDKFACKAAGIILVKVFNKEMGRKRRPERLLEGVSYSRYCKSIDEIKVPGEYRGRSLDRFLWVAGHCWSSKGVSKSWKKFLRESKLKDRLDELLRQK